MSRSVDDDPLPVGQLVEFAAGDVDQFIAEH